MATSLAINVLFIIRFHLFCTLMEKQWFESWFDTPYYHILYKNRDLQEAHDFLDRILEHIPLQPSQKILDLACGKGRHSIYLAQKGFDVTGVDLSPENIHWASQFSKPNLRFEIKDMRDRLGNEIYDAVMNLFTGFGYFDSDEENFGVFDNIYQSLKPGGYFLFDYLNDFYVRNQDNNIKEFVSENIGFRTSKEFTKNRVIKKIEVQDGPHTYSFSEKVALYNPQTISDNLTQRGFHILEQYGSYLLEEYEETSPRCIFVAQRSI